MKITESFKTKVKILENEKDLLAPLKIKNIELTNELNTMKQEENSKNTIREQQNIHPHLRNFFFFENYLLTAEIS